MRQAGRLGVWAAAAVETKLEEKAGVSSGLNRTGFGFGDFNLRAVTPLSKSWSRGMTLAAGWEGDAEGSR